MEVDLVRAILPLQSWKKSHLEPGVIPRHERNAILRVFDYLPVQKVTPEAREAERVIRIEGHRDEVTRHYVLHRRSAESDRDRELLPAREECNARRHWPAAPDIKCGPAWPRSRRIAAAPYRVLRAQRPTG